MSPNAIHLLVSACWLEGCWEKILVAWWEFFNTYDVIHKFYFKFRVCHAKFPITSLTGRIWVYVWAIQNERERLTISVSDRRADYMDKGNCVREVRVTVRVLFVQREYMVCCTDNLKNGLLHLGSGVKKCCVHGTCSRGIFLEVLLTVRWGERIKWCWYLCVKGKGDGCRDSFSRRPHAL